MTSTPPSGWLRQPRVIWLGKGGEDSLDVQLGRRGKLGFKLKLYEQRGLGPPRRARARDRFLANFTLELTKGLVPATRYVCRAKMFIQEESTPYSVRRWHKSLAKKKRRKLVHTEGIRVLSLFAKSPILKF
ncbi:uncharacterized protein CIMG_12744 [Coccidioides immitis RS]|uniref:Uncharacterized protein n=1 Tax=Coccidioides immitis (strain RS) TaxID=246410 RepID=A0A0D8JS57_COCIM|nr:uncharacterized protein CIMG_12744 [Coccidioides immitis RS]KJF60102.1 hypothetical protein CIMG_12744 [Coccidioides immitis RS]